MSWTPLHDNILCQEIIFVNPYLAKKKSVQRSALWQKIADNLNSVKDPHFIVDKRAVRDHIGVLVQRYKRQEAQERKESGTNPERTELDVAIEQIIAMEESADTEQQEASNENKEKLEADRRTAEDIRKKAMETMGKTEKRKMEEGNCGKAKKSRRNGSETLEYLRETVTEEFEWKKQEKESRDLMFKTMIEQQQQQQKQVQEMQSMMLMQQQAQTQALMGLIEKLVPK